MAVVALLVQAGCSRTHIESQKVTQTGIMVPSLAAPAVQEQNCFLIHAILHSDRNGPENIFTFRINWPEDRGKRLYAGYFGHKVSLMIDGIEAVNDPAQPGRQCLHIKGDTTFSTGMPSLWGWSAFHQLNQLGSASGSSTIVEYKARDTRYGLAVVVTPVHREETLQVIPFGNWIDEHWNGNLAPQVYTFCGGSQPDADRNRAQWERHANHALMKMSEGEYLKRAL
ncbi:hypothetical protein LLG95_15135 [bacterium]|nr:hypothetical protein [bacterium]